MRYNSIRKLDISNGPGPRVSLFTQGCNIYCPGCFNSELWDYSKGKEFTHKEKKLICDLVSDPYIEGLSILGGEPLSNQNVDTLFDLCQEIKHRFCFSKSIWLWTGKTLTARYLSLLPLAEYLDVIVDGPFEQELQDTSLQFRGSSNQRIIDVQKSLNAHKVIPYEV